MSDRRSSSQEARQRLYEIIRGDATFSEKAQEILELGKRYLGAENGHLTRIDQKTGHWEATISTDPPDGQFPAGMELDLGQTYCRRTMEASSPIALHDAPAQGWASDPAFEAHGLHCYLGATLVLDESPYGTVCFVAEDPRREQFGDEETVFVELVARLLERELERGRDEAELARQTNLATVLNRVLRHNLRNDITVIRGYIEFIADQVEDDTYADSALRSIDELIELSQKARELDRIIATEFERESTEIVALVEGIAETVTADYPDASVTVESSVTITTTVLPSFDQAIEELLENAAKHGGASPTVTVTVDTVPNSIEIRIADDGPGLSDREAAVLETGAETPLTHGSGLGLWLAHWIVTSHDGIVDATVTENGTTMTISVPRKPATSVQQRLTTLTRTRDQYRAAFEEASDAMVIINDDARIVDANQKAATIYGLDEQTLLGKSLRRFHLDGSDFDAAWQQFKSGEVVRDTVTVDGGDNVTRHVEYSATTDIVPGQHLVISREVAGDQGSSGR